MVKPHFLGTFTMVIPCFMDMNNGKTTLFGTFTMVIPCFMDMNNGKTTFWGHLPWLYHVLWT